MVLSWNLGAQVPDRPWTLHWDAPEGCPKRSDLEEQIEQLLGTPSAAALKVSVRARAWRGEDAAWRVEIHTETQGILGERKVEGSTCRAVTDAAALIIAMAVDPEAVAAHLGAPIGSASARPSESATSPRAPSSAVSPQKEKRETAAFPASSAGKSTPWIPEAVGVTVLAHYDVGSLPSGAPGVGGIATAGWGAYRLEVGGVWWSPQETSLGAGRGGEFSLWGVELRGCRDVRFSPLTLSGCGGVEVGRISGLGRGVTDPGEAKPVWLAGLLGLQGSVRVLGPMVFQAEIGAAVPIKRPDFHMEPYGHVHQPSAITLRLSSGLGLRF